MSNIYIQEPPTSGKVLLTTTVGEIEIELWSRETPKACRNFVQLCLEGYYEGTIFHRVVKNFIVQGGDPTGTGEGGESIYDEPFRDEIHSRLRFNRRGLVAMANAGRHDNGSQFFFTLGNTPELQEKHTIFGKVVGDTLFNMLKLGDVAINNERPLFPHKIMKTEVLNNPFTDIAPRERKRMADRKRDKPQAVAVKNFKLLSFGEEAEEDEEEIAEENKKFEGKSKSTNDKAEEPKKEDDDEGPLLEDDVPDEEPKQEEEAEEIDNEKFLSYVQSKLRPGEVKASSSADMRSRIKPKDPSEKKPKKEKKPKDSIEEKQDEKQESVIKKEYMDEISVYAEMKKNLPKKGKSREAQTLEMLGKFKNKMDKLKYGDDEEKKEAVDADWMMHTFQSDAPRLILSKDANMKDGDWYDITDPRNTLNKRRREDGLGKTAKKNKYDA